MKSIKPKLLTEAQNNALGIMRETYGKPITSICFFDKMWSDKNYELRKKRICGGSYLRKLEKKGWIRVTIDGIITYSITKEGINIFEINKNTE